MIKTMVKVYSLSCKDVKAYAVASLFVIGNLLFPQLCHLMPQGGLIWLPIYFFTLIAAYKYGLAVGLMTAVMSPILNGALFGMPTVAALPVILIKSIVLAVGAATIARYTQKVSMLGVLLAVIFYQVVGGIVEYGITMNIYAAIQDVTLGLPGIAVQVIGGYLVLKYVLWK